MIPIHKPETGHKIVSKSYLPATDTGQILDLLFFDGFVKLSETRKASILASYTDVRTSMTAKFPMKPTTKIMPKMIGTIIDSKPSSAASVSANPSPSESHLTVAFM